MRELGFRDFRTWGLGEQGVVLRGFEGIYTVRASGT